MSVDHDFYYLQAKKRLTAAFLKEKLGDEFEVTIFREDDGFVQFFSVSPKKQGYGPLNNAKVEFGGRWGKQINRDESQNIYSYRVCMSYASFRDETRLYTYKLYARIAELLGMVIDDPQYNQAAITPEKFATGEFRKPYLDYVAMQEKKKKKWWKFW